MSASEKTPEVAYAMDPVLMAVLANRLNAIVREMTNTLLRTARSSVLAVVRDFSCSLVTADNRLLCPGEGVPVHIFGSALQTQAMCDLHEKHVPLHDARFDARAPAPAPAPAVYVSPARRALEEEMRRSAERAEAGCSP